MKFNPAAKQRDKRIRESVGYLSSKVKKEAGRAAENIAILATRNRGVEIVSRALTGDGKAAHIPHFVFVDDANVLLASRVVAFLLEPKGPGRELDYLAEGLELVASAFRARGSKGWLLKAQRCQEGAEQARAGKVVGRLKTAREFLEIVKRVGGRPFVGDPKRDWLHARGDLETAKSGDLRDLAADASQLRAFGRGQRITERLAEAWQARGAYADARGILDAAIAQEQLLDGTVHTRGISVMTVHKSKGKEFDGVIIIDDANNSPLIFSAEGAPYPRSRRLLRVGITRACHHVLMLTDLFQPSELLTGHRL
jgi:DNA helicase-2/ATP-dependent DNA helicase PcrA